MNRQLRKGDTTRTTVPLYTKNACIRVVNGKHKKFIVSKLVTEKMNFNIKTDALMFDTDGVNLFLSKEPLAKDNYRLTTYEASCDRFVNRELFERLIDLLGLSSEIDEFFLLYNHDTRQLTLFNPLV